MSRTCKNCAMNSKVRNPKRYCVQHQAYIGDLERVGCDFHQYAETALLKVMGQMVMLIYDALPMLLGRNRDKADKLISEYDEIRS